MSEGGFQFPFRWVRSKDRVLTDCQRKRRKSFRGFDLNVENCLGYRCLRVVVFLVHMRDSTGSAYHCYEQEACLVLWQAECPDERQQVIARK